MDNEDVQESESLLGVFTCKVNLQAYGIKASGSDIAVLQFGEYYSAEAARGIMER
jgi:hypothetical protein